MIRVERLNLALGSFALQDLSLEVAAGEYFVLLGPSGAGKTLFLECLCGLNRINSGRIIVGGVDVTALEPRNRRIGYLPQDYALFPHQTVRQNAAFGLNRKLLAGQSVAQRVDQLLEMTGVAHLADRLPRNLSGGEKQRVALARALAIQPQVLLLDEPVSALDEQTRDSLCRGLKQLQRETGTTTIHVCHNFAEMLAVADRVGIIHQGTILQSGTPRWVLERPRTRLVAQFVQAGNLLAGRAFRDGPWLRLVCPGGVEFHAVHPERPTIALETAFVVRPENVHLLNGGARDMPPGSTRLEGKIVHLMDCGPLVQLTVTCPADIAMRVSLGKKEYRGSQWAVGDRVHLAVAPEDVHILED
jgi:ABC-type Fe3+/spermidine/putrescine transport system ATPase subunit